jgi:hypothetical protein
MKLMEKMGDTAPWRMNESRQSFCIWPKTQRKQLKLKIKKKKKKKKKTCKRGGSL